MRSYAHKEEKKINPAKLTALSVYHSFDSEAPVYLFSAEEEAVAELKKQVEDEIRIETKEAGHVLGEDIFLTRANDYSFAQIRIITPDGEESLTEWNLGQIIDRTKEGDRMKRYLLATNAGKESLHEYFWYPKAKEDEILVEKKRIEGADFHRRYCVHYLEGESHAAQYGEWRDALINRTQVFKDNKFLFNEQVIQGFRPSGSILFVKMYDPTMNERLTSLRTLVGKNKKDFASSLGIPYRTYQDWELGNNKMPEYILDLIGFRVKNDPTLSD